MLARSLTRLWAPKYFRGQNKAARHPRPRSAPVDFPGSSSSPACASTTSAKPPRSTTKQSSTSVSPPTSVSPSRQPSATFSPSLPATVVAADPIVQQARSLLVQLSLPPSSSSSSVSTEATHNFVGFAARRDVLGPLRHRLPAAPVHLTARGTGSPSAKPVGATPRLRVIPSPHGSPIPLSTPPPLQAKEAPDEAFRLSELVTFLQLYDAVGADDGPLLVQLMAEVHRQLLLVAEAQTNLVMKPAKEGGGPRLDGDSSNRGTEALPALPLPALLFTMSSLGIVEEAVLDLITSASTITTTNTTNAPSYVRRGLLYRQLPRYSTEELMLLVVALHRFGHAQQLSMKAVSKALRASLYNPSTPSGAFHRVMKSIKKQMYRTMRTAAGSASPPADEVASPSSFPLSNEGGVVRALKQHSQLPSLVLAMQCPMFLLLEALTASSLTVYRRTDIVSFFSDWIAVAAVMELSAALRGDSNDRSRLSAGSSRRKEDDTNEYVVYVAHQLLRAAKLTEEMELPQPLLSEVFAWSCTLSGKGVVVDGGEDREVPSDRVAFYDHVTADLIKANRTD